jgi:hypothetical protein
VSGNQEGTWRIIIFKNGGLRNLASILEACKLTLEVG